jgi:hypothetical protein
VADDYTQWGFAYKQDVNPRTSVLLMLSKPFGLDIAYSPLQSPLLAARRPA